MGEPPCIDAERVSRSVALRRAHSCGALCRMMSKTKLRKGFRDSGTGGQQRRRNTRRRVGRCEDRPRLNARFGPSPPATSCTGTDGQCDGLKVADCFEKARMAVSGEIVSPRKEWTLEERELRSSFEAIVVSFLFIAIRVV